MRILFALLFPFFLIAAGACKKPVLEVTDGTIPPMVLTAAIEDSLPSKTIRALSLEDVTGLKVQYYSGVHTSYFEYKADKGLLLETISELPFPMNSNLSDTHCRQISLQALLTQRETVSAIELESASHFWQAIEADHEIFECIKAPFRHTLQVAKNGNLVLHRIELLGQI
jgi:hypothetical protein